MKEPDIYRIRIGQQNIKYTMETTIMEKRQEDIQRHINYISQKTGKNFSSEIYGILGVVKQDGHIIFTSAGMQNSASIESFLAGLVYALSNL